MKTYYKGVLLYSKEVNPDDYYCYRCYFYSPNGIFNECEIFHGLYTDNNKFKHMDCSTMKPRKQIVWIKDKRRLEKINNILK